MIQNESKFENLESKRRPFYFQFSFPFSFSTHRRKNMNERKEIDLRREGKKGKELRNFEELL